MKKNLFSLFLAIIFVFSMSLSASASNLVGNAKKVVSTVNYEPEQDIDKLIELALQQKNSQENTAAGLESFNSNSENTLEVTQLVQETIYSDGSNEKTYEHSILSTVYTTPGSSSGSGGKYDVGVVVTLNYTISYTLPLGSWMRTKMNNVTVKHTDANADPIYVSKINLEYHGFLDPSSPQFDRYSTINNPVSGTTYTLNCNDTNSYYQTGFTNVYGGARVTFSNSTYIDVIAVLPL